MINRYSRQELFSFIGQVGQKKIQQKHVLIVGAGALGSSNAEILVRAGIGKLSIVDRDYVDWSNLQRQQLYSEEDVFQHLPKAVAAKQRLEKINRDVLIEAIVLDISSSELFAFQDVDLIIDATDNFETRFLLNDFAVKYEIPWIYGACVGSYGITYTILPHETPCLHCLMEIIPLFGGTTCDTVGIIAPTVTQVVSHQMVEALKILVEDWEAIRKELLAFDLWKNEQTKINVKSLKKSTCLTCGLNPTYPYLTKESITKVAVLCGRNTVQIRPAKPKLVNIIEFEKNLAPHVQHLKSNPFLIHFQVNQNQIILFRDGRVLIHGTNDIVEAKKIYHQYFG